MAYTWNLVFPGQVADDVAINGLGAAVTSHDLAITALQATDMVYRARQTLSASQATILFAAIPATALRVAVYWKARGDGATATVDVRMQINGTVAAVYLTQTLQGSGAAASAALNPGSVNSSQVGITTAATASAGIFGSGVVEFQGWDVSPLCHVDRSEALAGAGFTTAGGGTVAVAAPFTSVTLLLGAGNFVAGSDFQLEAW